jgi:hypothetical protein
MKHQKIKCLKPTDHSHSISVRGDDVEDVLVIPLNLHGIVSCFPTFKPSQEEFETCDRYELTLFETPEYDPSTRAFHDQEAGITDSWGNPLRQKEFEIKQLTVKYSDTYAKLQDLSAVLDDGTLLAEFMPPPQI